jgi:bacterioferritin-associated ferredoxin
MYVCICHAVSDRTIREAAQRGVNTLEALAAETGTGTCCGACRPFALKILEDHGTGARHAFGGTVAA